MILNTEELKSVFTQDFYLKSTKFETQILVR